MPRDVVIERRFNGPQDSGNGGYSCGVFAAQLEVDTAQTTLRRPVPLGRPLRVERDSGTARVLDGDELIAEARAVPALDLELPSAPSLEDARAATEGYPGERGALFSNCFVCGLDRADAFGVFAGPLANRNVVASPWTPPDWTADDSGEVRPPFVWAVLDCPTYFACYHDASPLPLSFLGRMTGHIEAPVRARSEHVVVAWPISADGRKREAGAAVYSATGDVLAAARATLIEPRASG
jgi:hypothetical protein